MSREMVNRICHALPGAECSDPWGGGHDCWKVGGRMFANVGGYGDGVDVKCADVDTAALLIDLGLAARAPYMHRSWVRLPFPAAEEDLRSRLHASYRIIRGTLTKKLQATLGEMPPTA